MASEKVNSLSFQEGTAVNEMAMTSCKYLYKISLKFAIYTNMWDCPACYIQSLIHCMNQLMLVGHIYDKIPNQVESVN